MAYPFPIAAVVLPAASKMSVLCLAYSNSAISAIPPALSEIGPYPSMVRQMHIVESIPRAASEMPYISAIAKVKKIVRAMQVIGTAVE